MNCPANGEKAVCAIAQLLGIPPDTLTDKLGNLTDNPSVLKALHICVESAGGSPDILDALGVNADDLFPEDTLNAPPLVLHVSPDDDMYSPIRTQIEQIQDQLTTRLDETQGQFFTLGWDSSGYVFGIFDARVYDQDPENPLAMFCRQYAKDWSAAVSDAQRYLQGKPPESGRPVYEFEWDDSLTQKMGAYCAGLRRAGEPDTHALREAVSENNETTYPYHYNLESSDTPGCEVKMVRTCGEDGSVAMAEFTYEELTQIIESGWAVGRFIEKIQDPMAKGISYADEYLNTVTYGWG